MRVLRLHALAQDNLLPGCERHGRTLPLLVESSPTGKLGTVHAPGPAGSTRDSEGCSTPVFKESRAIPCEICRSMSQNTFRSTAHATRRQGDVSLRLLTCSRVFVRCHRVRHPMQFPCHGCLEVRRRGNGTFKVTVNGTLDTARIGRLKPATIDYTNFDSPISPVASLRVPLTSVIPTALSFTHSTQTTMPPPVLDAL